MTEAAPSDPKPRNHNPTNNPLHGMTLEKILERLVQEYGWPGLGKKIKIRCFNADPSIKSSLTFLRKTPWARKRVEDLFMAMPTRYINPAPKNVTSGDVSVILTPEETS